MTAPVLTALGAPLRTTSNPPGSPTAPLKGSRRASVSTGPYVPKPIVYDIRPGWTHNPLIQCAPGERPFGAGFSAVGVGRDVATGRVWAEWKPA